jgi:hypothetical protein
LCQHRRSAGGDRQCGCGDAEKGFPHASFSPVAGLSASLAAPGRSLYYNS